MGKATIQSGGTDGKYSILYNINKTRMEERTSKLTESIQQAEAVELPVLEAALASVEEYILALEGELNIEIAAGDEEEIKKITSYLNTARIQQGEAKSQVAGKKAEIVSLKASKIFLENNLPVDQVIDAWCADFSEGLAGEVGTMDVPGERTAPIIIRAAGEIGTGAAYNASTDGQITPGLGLSPEEAFYNQAMLPGWQRWQPAYRLAAITAIDNLTDTCEIVLDAAFSSQKDEGDVPFDVNRTEIYGSSPVCEDVPITYMKCNSYAFSVGDRVVVKFEKNLLNQTDPLDYRPKVVGFESNPKECIPFYHHAFDLNGDIVRTYGLLGGIWPQFENSKLISRFYTPSTIVKKYNGKTYTLYTDELSPKVTIDDDGDITEYPLPPIQQDANWYSEKRFEVKDDAIYVHDYAYSYDSPSLSPTQWTARQQILPPHSERMRTMIYTLGMTLLSTTYHRLPFFYSAYFASDKIYLLGTTQETSLDGYWEGKVYIYNHEWAYQGENNLNFLNGREQSIAGWEKEKIIIGNKQSESQGQSYVRCFDMDMNQLWKTGLGAAAIFSIVTNGKYVFVGCLAPPGTSYYNNPTGTGRIYVLNIDTGAFVSSYNLPIVPNPGLTPIPTYDENGNPYPLVNGWDTVYTPHRMAIIDDTLYIAVGHYYVYPGTTHPRAYIFDVSNGNLMLVGEGVDMTVGMQPGTTVVYSSTAAWELIPFAIAACRQAWWLLLGPAPESWRRLGMFTETGGYYIFHPKGFEMRGVSGDNFETNSGAMF